ncbi:hypothetical protein MVEN_02621800 [Mycena venus]|uniref:ATP synthase subunit K, mitochondrial n=1 Tax=Mycena venus TaxID=2733690 RepID=A0A8H6TZ24_9AGAR|nr:hypothetical protein MVEN_02621800 [Mycena venus]
MVEVQVMQVGWLYGRVRWQRRRVYIRQPIPKIHARYSPSTMTYTILGRAIPKEYLSMGVLGSIASFVVYKNATGKAAAPKTIAEAKKAVPINAGSSEEELLMDSIRKFIADAEKETGAAGSSKH